MPPDDVLVGGLPDVKMLLMERYQKERAAAIERATKANLIAYPIKGDDRWAGIFAVPSQTELGSVYLCRVNLRSGEPASIDGLSPCTCPNPKQWCTHVAAAVLFVAAERESDDNLRAQEAAAGIIQLKKEREHGDTD